MPILNGGRRSTGSTHRTLRCETVRGGSSGLPGEVTGELRPRWGREGGPAVAARGEATARETVCAREKHGTSELV